MEIDAQHESGCSLPEVEKVNGLWFEDGNIVVVAQNKGFRVHKGVLSQHSVVFKDMFALDSIVQSTKLVQDSDGLHDEVDGVPAVYLQGDSAEDMTYFLRLLYDWTFLYNCEQTTFPIASGLLRISTKYLAGPIRKAMIAKILSDYPAINFQLRYARISRFDEQEFAYFRLACEANVNSVLPELYYAVSKHPLKKIKEQLGGVDASTLQRLTSGRKKVHAIEVKVLLADILRSSIVNHVEGIQCRSVITLHARRHRTYIPPFIEGSFIRRFPGKGICLKCSSELYNIVNRFNNFIRPQLPHLFRLKDWNALIRMDEESTVF